MKLTIKIRLDNAAFEAEGESSRFANGHEPARILRRLAADIEAGGNIEAGESWNLHDVNGNTCGQARTLKG